MHDLTAEDAATRLLKLVGTHGGRGRRCAPARFPGARATVFNAPARNARFTGREDLLRRLREELRARGQRSPPVALRGGPVSARRSSPSSTPTGSGRAYDIIWWVAADPPQFVDVLMTELSDELGLPSQATSRRPTAPCGSGWVRPSAAPTAARRRTGC